MFSTGIEKNQFEVPLRIKSDLVRSTLKDLFSTFKDWQTKYIEEVFDDKFRKAVLRILLNPGSATQHDTTEMDDPIMYQAALLVQDIREKVTDGKDEESKARIKNMAQSMASQTHEIISLQAAIKIMKANEKKLQVCSFLYLTFLRYSDSL